MADILRRLRPEIQDAQLGLRTYYVYIQSYVACYENTSSLLDNQRQLPAFKRLCHKKTDVNSLREPLLRGWITLKAMETLPLENYPELAKTANFWLPVQAYYAAHGIGLATLIAMGSDTPKDHRAFLSQVANQIVTKLLPHPFNMACGGDPSRISASDVRIENFNGNIADVKSISSLSNPLYAQGGLLVAKSLLTTRRRSLEDLFEREREKKVRPGRRRRNLTPDEKNRITEKRHPTTVFDFLYRIRVRSNYDDPEIFIYGQTDQDTAVNHYKNLVKMCKSLMECLEKIIEQKVGPDVMLLKRDLFK